MKNKIIETIGGLLMVFALAAFYGGTVFALPFGQNIAERFERASGGTQISETLQEPFGWKKTYLNFNGLRL